MNDLIASSPDTLEATSDFDARPNSETLPYYLTQQQSSRSRLTAQEAIDALVQARGNVAEAARQLRKSRQALQNFIDKTPSVLHCLRTLRETLLDTAEHNFYKAIEGGHLESSRFILQTFGKDRGYTRPGVNASASDSAGNKVTFTIEG